MITAKVRLKMKDGTIRLLNTKRNGTCGEDGKVFSVPVSDSTIKRIDVVVIDDGFGDPVPGQPGLRSYTRKVRIAIGKDDLKDRTASFHTNKAAMATTRINNPSRELTLHFYHASGERNQPDELRDGLRDLGLVPRLVRQNPATSHDGLILALDLTQKYGPAVGAALVTLLSLWLKQTKNRRIEIERPGLKVKAATVRDLEKALTALQHYDELNLTLHNSKPIKQAKKNTAGIKRKSK